MPVGQHDDFSWLLSLWASLIMPQAIGYLFPRTKEN